MEIRRVSSHGLLTQVCGAQHRGALYPPSRRSAGFSVIARDGWIDFDAPPVDAARHATGIGYALLAQPVDHLQAANSVMAEYNEVSLVGPAFNGLKTGRNGPHRNQMRSFDASSPVRLRLAHMDQDHALACVHAPFDLSRRDFDRGHPPPG